MSFSGSSTQSHPIRRPWTEDEDTALVNAVQQLGSPTGSGSGPTWTAISKAVGGRSNRDCRKRWFHTLDPSLKRGRWSEEEDAALRIAFAQFGARWSEIAKQIPGRTDEQVAKRWRDVLSPALNLDAPWSEDEDFLLRSLFVSLGPKWTLMSDSFPARNGIACRNRFRALQRLRQREGTEPSIAATSPPIETDPSRTFDPKSSDHQMIERFLESLHDPHIPVIPPDNQLGTDFLVDRWLNDDLFGRETSSIPLNIPSEVPTIKYEPISNVWDLLVALETGVESVAVSSSLLRQLLADASHR